jgi:hypothetical protein
MSTTFSSTNHLVTLITTKQHTRKLLGVQEPTLVVFSSLFFEFLTPFTLWGCNFLIFSLFSMMVSVWNVPRRGFKFCLDNINNITLPLNLAYPECLNVWSLANLPYMFGYMMKTKYMNLAKKNSHLWWLKTFKTTKYLFFIFLFDEYATIKNCWIKMN